MLVEQRTGAGEAVDDPDRHKRHSHGRDAQQSCYKIDETLDNLEGALHGIIVHGEDKLQIAPHIINGDTPGKAFINGCHGHDAQAQFSAVKERIHHLVGNRLRIGNRQNDFIDTQLLSHLGHELIIAKDRNAFHAFVSQACIIVDKAYDFIACAAIRVGVVTTRRAHGRDER